MGQLGQSLVSINQMPIVAEQADDGVIGVTDGSK